MPNLKLLSLNLHCLVEEDLETKQQIIANTIADRDIDIIFLQEVAQSEELPLVHDSIKQDNYAYTLQQILQTYHKEYHLIFIPIKRSFNRFDEGLAILSRYPFELVSEEQISHVSDYNNWRRRKILVCYVPVLDMHIATTHFGWTSRVERFERQVDNALSTLPSQRTWIMAGDYNVRPDSNEYNYLLEKGCFDLFVNSPHETHPTHIDDMDIHHASSRIDYFMSNKQLEVITTDVLFVTNRVSDHYGVYLEIKT